MLNMVYNGSSNLRFKPRKASKPYRNTLQYNLYNVAIQSVSTIPKIEVIGIVDKNVVIATVAGFTVTYIYIFMHIYA